MLDFLTSDLPAAFAPAHLIDVLTTHKPLLVQDVDQDLSAWRTDDWETPYWLVVLQQALVAIGIMSLLVGEWCRVMQRSQTFGPLVIMAIEMVKDVIYFLTLVSGLFIGTLPEPPVLWLVPSSRLLAIGPRVPLDAMCPCPFAAFAFALINLYKGLSSESNGEGTIADACAFLLVDGDELGGLGPSVVALLEIMLGAGPDMDTCLHASAQAVSAPIVMDVFRVMITLLALNMLIAQMSTTYDRIREKLATNFQFLTALMTIEWTETPLVPAPLHILSVPYYVLYISLTCVFLVLDYMHVWALAVRAVSRVFRRCRIYATALYAHWVRWLAPYLKKRENGREWRLLRLQMTTDAVKEVRVRRFVKCLVEELKQACRHRTRELRMPC